MGLVWSDPTRRKVGSCESGDSSEVELVGPSEGSSGADAPLLGSGKTGSLARTHLFGPRNETHLGLS